MGWLDVTRGISELNERIDDHAARAGFMTSHCSGPRDPGTGNPCCPAIMKKTSCGSDSTFEFSTMDGNRRKKEIRFNSMGVVLHLIGLISSERNISLWVSRVLISSCIRTSQENSTSIREGLASIKGQKLRIRF